MNDQSARTIAEIVSFGLLLTRTHEVLKKLQPLQRIFNHHVFLEESQIESVRVESTDDEEGVLDRIFIYAMTEGPDHDHHVVIFQDQLAFLTEGAGDMLVFEEWRDGKLRFANTVSQFNNDWNFSALWDRCVDWEDALTRAMIQRKRKRPLRESFARLYKK